MLNKREKSLDYLRGLAIIQVVMVHILYWFDIFNAGVTEIAKSFLLFEMPVFFFVSGAVNTFGKQQSYISFCVKRIKGILVPYYVYSAICILICFGYNLIFNRFSLGYAFKIILSWLVPVDLQIMPLPYFTWAVWFIPVYIISVLLFPLIINAVLRFRGAMILFLILIFGAFEFIFSCNCFKEADEYVKLLTSIVQKTSFYLIFSGLGVLYSRIKVRNRKKLYIALIVFFLSILGLLISKLIFGCTLDMQINKFPPNHSFLFYSFAVFSLMYIMAPFGKKVYLKLVNLVPAIDKWVILFSQNSVYVFLYQSFAFMLVGGIIHITGLKNDVLLLISAMITVYPIIYMIIRFINLLPILRKNIKHLHKA